MTRRWLFWSISPKVAAFAELVGFAKFSATPSVVWDGSRENMPLPFITAWTGFPPQTLEVQLDKKWSFVAKKEANCGEADDAELRDRWDHVAFDPEHRLVLVVIPGKRTLENAEALVEEVKRRLDGQAPRLIASNAYPAYETAILHAYGQVETPARTGKPSRPRSPRIVPALDLNYAVVEKTKESGRVVAVSFRVVFGSEEEVKAALEASRSSRSINTSFIERYNGTDRHRSSRKVRKTCGVLQEPGLSRCINIFVYVNI